MQVAQAGWKQPDHPKPSETGATRVVQAGWEADLQAWQRAGFSEAVINPYHASRLKLACILSTKVDGWHGKG